jgi:NAD(P)-dependent dehydrogenase (short-subunit alcohol dehydrogenase family)
MAPFPSPTSVWRSETYDSISPTRPELSAKGKNVIITGGGTGIGAETARYFAKAGASRIGLLGRRQQPLDDTKASLGKEFPQTEVFVASADVTKKSEIDAAIAKFAGNSQIHVLVSNAAVIGPQDPVATVDGDQFMNAVQLNIQGSLFVAQAFLPHAASDAVVVEVNSSVAHLNFGPGFASYGVSKFAVYRLWDSLAFANPNLAVYHIQPGVVDTAMNREAGGVDAIGFQDNGKCYEPFESSEVLIMI